MNKTIKLSLLLFVFLMAVAAQASEHVTVRVNNSSCDVREFADEVLFFANRTYVIQNLPESFYGYQFLARNAGKSVESLQSEVLVKPDQNGFIYLIASYDSWIRGWRKVKNSEFHYNDHKFTKLAVYRKKTKRGEIVNLPDDEGFVGTTLLAPAVVCIEKEPVELRGALLDIRRVEENVPVFPQNNTFKFRDDLPEEIRGLEYGVSLIEKPGVERFRVTSDESNVFAALSTNNLKNEEWEFLNKSFAISSKRTYCLYRLKNSAINKWIEAPTATDAIQQPASPTLLFAERLVWENPKQVPGVVITQTEELKAVNIANPSFVILPNGDYLAASSGALRKRSERGGVSFFVSKDKGNTWEVRSANSVQMTFYTLFVHEGELYILGTNPGYGDVVIAKSKDWGQTWTNPVVGAGVIRNDGFYHSAPVPVVYHEGRIWRSMENTDNRRGRNKRAMIMSAPMDADLLDAASWTFSNELSSKKEWIDNNERSFKQWLEGNIVIDRDGNPVNILRVDEEKMGGVAAIVRVNTPSEITFDPQKDIIDFPGGGKKFTIRYDSVSDKYWTITNAEFNEDRSKRQNGIYDKGIHCGLLRNRAVLMYSDDLYNWTIKESVVSSDNPFLHGFQYFDWQFDGDDIVAVARTAYEEERGLPTRQHDANFLTFHRVNNFRE